ncbi:T9SS type A sorting domain-containing protein [uncultured Porphyromonas sp.]|uniref:InlB B-repeat-containing protein n=1 Tax=uncultured Porphyromonas sp. TaxID=159274 RepID=UPI002619D395|nr:T9SS type A sorting domain-containing protein [uncultured Porphyromonas sp.]
MSKQLRIWLFVLIGTLLTSTSLLAEGVITMTTSKAVGEEIELIIKANGNVTIEGVKETPQLGWKRYTLSNQTVTIRGDVTKLSCSSWSQLTSLDVSGCTALTELYCGDNQLTSLDVSKNIALTELGCGGNQLTSLDVSQNTALTTLSCVENQLTSLDVSQNTALTSLSCWKNQLTSLEVSQNIALTSLSCGYNELTSLDVSKNTALTALDCCINQLTSLDLSKNTALTKLSCYNNQLTSLALSHNSKLWLLFCYYNQIKGAEMTKLVNSLPKKNGEERANFYVVVKDSIEGNVCLKSDVAILAKKGWTPLGCNRSTEACEYYGGRETDSFGVSLTHEGEGLLDATGADDLKAVPYGTKLTITATPAEGYELVALTVNGFDILESKSFVVTGYTEVKATFTKKVKSFAVMFTQIGEGYLNATGADDLDAVPYGTELTIEATPATGYELTALTANGRNILSTKRFVVKEDTEVKATFAQKTLAVTLTHDGEGKVDATGAEDLTAVPYGTELTIVATPKQGYELTALTANDKDILATKKVVVTENLTIKATFAKETFVVTLDKEGEGVLDATGADNLKAVPYGTKLTITATPAEGYELKALLADGFDIRSTKSVEVTGDTRIKAIFTQQTFAVTLTSNEHGKITIVEPVDLQAVPYGTTLTISATPETGYELTALTANGEDILATKNFVVKGATEIRATFSMAHFAVTLTHEGEGKVDATGAEDLTAVPYGTELTIVATPKQGYELTALTANDKDILATKKVVVTENTTIKATFAKETFVVTLDKEGEGVLDATGADDLKAVPYGTKLTITATPAEGYELKALLADGFDILSTKSVEVTGDTRIKAIFRKKTFAVTLTSNEHGTISIVEPVDLDVVAYGTTLTVKATGKNAQCVLTALTANGEDILATQSFVVKGATEVKATFVDHTGVETTVTQQTQLYPNPATDYVIVEGVAPASEVTLHSMTGERLYAERADSRGTLRIDLTPYADGVYLVCVAGETYRVVVRH